MKKKALILVNVGTPDKPEIYHVGKYLFQFLNDPRVIDVPWLLRMLLVNLIIIPFRVAKSTRLYRGVWTEDGSPLSIHMRQLVKKVQGKLQDEYKVVGVMRYGNPSLNRCLEQINAEGYDEVTILPLFPQYASSVTGSVHDCVKRQMRHWTVIPRVRFIDQFYDHPAFIHAFIERIQSYRPGKFDHILFSYHGLPVRQVQNTHPDISFQECRCESQMPAHGHHCYKAICYATTRLLVDRLDLSEEDYTTTFQSRLSRNWLMPFTDQVLRELAARGKKRILVVAPAFVADCLETKEEIAKSYGQLFKTCGGDELVLVESLNDSDAWVEAVCEIIR